MEVWKPVNGYEKHYEVSNIGRVRSLDVLVNSKHKLGRLKKGKLLKQENVIGGYKRVAFCVNNKKKRYSVHRLVASHFILNEKNKPQVNHIDKNTSNNRVENLEWVTIRENMSHQKRGENKFTGIHKLKNSNTYQVKIFIEGVNIYLGSSTNILKAKKIYSDYIKKNNIKNKYICH